MTRVKQGQRCRQPGGPLNVGSQGGALQAENEPGFERAGGRALRWEGAGQGGTQWTLSLGEGSGFYSEGAGQWGRAAIKESGANEGPNESSRF